MELKDQAIDGIKIFRDHTPSVDNDRKATQQGIMATDQATATGIYTVSQGGDEQGWLYTGPRTSSQRHDIGSWAQAVPAILRNSDSKIVPMQDKSQAVDLNYTAKTQATVAGDSATTVRVAETDGTGTPGIVVTCLNDAAQEQIFFPISDNKITVDNITGPNYSTKIYDIDALGAIDLTNVGTTKDLLYNENNKTYLKTDAEFREDTTNKGPINFETSGYPAITTPTTPTNYETKIVFDSGTNTWKMYTIAEASATATVFAKIRWRFWFDAGTLYDFSECELMNYDTATNTFSASGTVGWISQDFSKQCQFHTAGSETIFAVRLLNTSVVRDGITRDLYYCVQCVRESEYKITHFQTISPAYQMVDNRLRVFVCSNDLVASPWLNAADSIIKTSILGVEYSNEMTVNVPRQWRYITGSDYAWTEMHEVARGMEFWARPIRPVHTDDYLNHGYESAELFNGLPIAKYARTT